ncbi:MAG: CsbD family protein [Bdellovibrio sp.]|nr:CsbD family protein [Bdellovibrio sp.]
MNNDLLKGKWTEIKGEIQKTWGNLTGDDLEKTKGDMTAVGGLLQQKYGMAKEDASAKLSSIYDRFQNKKDEVLKSVAETAEQTKESIRNKQ